MAAERSASKNSRAVACSASSDSRSLVFEAGAMVLVTMRPSDVPTYVEAGAAEIGIVGKDVLSEQAERAVYELLDLRYGPCVMVVATIAGEDRLAEALRRLGVMRVATKYPKTATRHFERTGRQAEIVEVKGSVELAPLTGLVEAIVDRMIVYGAPIAPEEKGPILEYLVTHFGS